MFPPSLYPLEPTPDAPAIGNLEVFADQADSLLKQIDQHGTVTPLGGGGGSQPLVHIAFPFAFDTPDIYTANGVPVGYTSNPHDVLLDAWIEVVTAWDGDTPDSDLGFFAAGKDGWFGDLGFVTDLTSADSDGGVGFLYNYNTNPSLANVSGQNGSRRVPGVMYLAGDILSVIVFVQGSGHGTNPGSTVGAAIAHIVILPAAA